MQKTYLHLVPDAGDLSQTSLDGLRLLRVFRAQTVCLFSQVAQLVFDGCQVTLHPCQLPLQGHDSSQVVPQLLGRLNDLEEGRERVKGELDKFSLERMSRYSGLKCCRTRLFLFCGYLGLLFDPGLGLVTLQVVVLNTQSRVKTVLLLIHQVSELTPPGQMDRDAISNNIDE